MTTEWFQSQDSSKNDSLAQIEVPEESNWKKVLGIEDYKIKYHAQKILYKVFGVTLPKLRTQRKYWNRRSNTYMREVFELGHQDREKFFQNKIVQTLSGLSFDSCFEAGCGFGWNIRRMKEEFPDKKVGGVDLSIAQLKNSQKYMQRPDIYVANGDNCSIPLKANSYDIGFSLGVFMNIHQDNIYKALEEMIRVCRKYIVHVEWEAERAKEELREKRAFKTNIISHEYGRLYEKLGQKVLKIETHEDFAEEYHDFMSSIHVEDTRWEGFEGADKYTITLIEVQK